MKLTLAIAWTVLGLLTLLSDDGITKFDYFLVWAPFVLHLFSNASK